MGLQDYLGKLNKPIVWAAGFALVAAGSFYAYRQWKKDIVKGKEMLNINVNRSNEMTRVEGILNLSNLPLFSCP